MKYALIISIAINVWLLFRNIRIKAIALVIRMSFISYAASSLELMKSMTAHIPKGTIKDIHTKNIRKLEGDLYAIIHDGKINIYEDK